MLSSKRRERIVNKVRAIMERWYEKMPEPKGPITHYCLYWAGFTVAVLHEEKIPAVLQGGSSFWRTVPLVRGGVVKQNAEDIDSYGYKFEWGHEALKAVIAGAMPEMHVWTGIQTPKGGEIIDLTTGFVKDRVIADGFTWTAEYDPPPYLWASVKKIPEPAYYEPNKKATEIANQLFIHFLKGGGPLILNMGD